MGAPSNDTRQNAFANYITHNFTQLNLSLLVLFENPGKGYKVAFVLLNKVKLKIPGGDVFNLLRTSQKCQCVSGCTLKEQKNPWGILEIEMPARLFLLSSLQ
jgi:hypothetical protein